AAALARRAPEDQCVAAVLHQRLGFCVAIGAPHLGDTLEREHAAAAEFAKPRKRILQAIDGPERIELVDDKPEPLISLSAVHGFEDREPHPGADEMAERCDLARPIGEKEDPPAVP